MENPFDAGYYDSGSLRGFGFNSVGENDRIAHYRNYVGIENISIGDSVRIDGFTQIIAFGKGASLGSNIHIGGGCFLSARGGITMDDFSGLSQNAAIYSATDDYLGEAMTNPTVPSHLTKVYAAHLNIGRHAIVGSGAVILPGAHLEEGAAVGALSLVTKPLPPWTVYAGSPAHAVRARKRNPLLLEAQLRRVCAA